MQWQNKFVCLQLGPQNLLVGLWYVPFKVQYGPHLIIKSTSSDTLLDPCLKCHCIVVDLHNDSIISLFFLVWFIFIQTAIMNEYNDKGDGWWVLYDYNIFHLHSCNK